MRTLGMPLLSTSYILSIIETKATISVPLCDILGSMSDQKRNFRTFDLELNEAIPLLDYILNKLYNNEEYHFI